MKEALKLALEALEPLVSLSIEPEDLAGIYKAITAIKEALAQPNTDYERGVIEGRQIQAQSSVDKAVNRMAQPERPWVGLTDEELAELSASGLVLWGLWRAIEAKLKEKNT